MLTQCEMVILIVIGLIIQVFILSSAPIITRQVVDAKLNYRKINQYIRKTCPVPAGITG